MKKVNILFCLLLSAFCFLQVNAQTGIYQLLNGDFEAPFYNETSNVKSIVPYGFNSFFSASGSLASVGADQRTWSSTDVRPGSTGIQSVRLQSNTVLFVRANGNITTGRINADDMTAGGASNYNYTDYVPTTQYTPANPPKFIQEITGTPDSLRFWTKYLPGRNGTTNTEDKGRIRIYIHGTAHCRDAPQYAGGMTEKELYYGKASCEFYKENGGWQCYMVPFEYTGTNTQKNANGNYYVLVSMTTHEKPGGGLNNPDQVWFDDIEFIYSAWLTDLKINGVSIDGFQQGLLKYGGPAPIGSPGNFQFPLQPSDFSWTPQVSDIQGVVVTNVNGPAGDADGGYTSILVTAEDGVTKKEYRVYYYANLSPDNNVLAMSYSLDGTTPIAIGSPFNPLQTTYNISLENPEEIRVPQILESTILLSHPSAVIQRIEQPTGVNSNAKVVVQAENLKLKSYNIIFEKVKSANSKLNWIKVGGADIAGFNPDILTYNYSITTCTSTIPTITYEKTSVYANVNYVPATYNGNRTATITVTAENGTQTIYKVNFSFTNIDVSFTRFRFSGGNSYDITPIAGQTVYERAFSFTAAQTITPTFTCASVIVNRVPATTVYYPDTNYFHVKSLSLTDSITYKIVLKNTNCFLATGNNNALRYNYNGLVNQNTAINITTTHNGNLNPVITTVVTTPIGPNVPAQLVVYGLATASNAAPPTYQIFQPEHRKDTAVVTLTANDGVTQKIYRVPFSFTPSPDATLKSITYNGLNVPGFAPATENYTLIFPSSVSEVPTIEAIPNFQWLPEENIVINDAATLNDATTIVVTAESGATKTYTIAFEVIPQEKDAYLIDIRYDNQTIRNFNPTIYDYTIDIPYSNPLPPQITVTPSSPTALPFFAAQMQTPPYTQQVLVFSEDMTVTKLYKVDFIRVKNTNAALGDIKINGVSLDGFDPEEFEYEYELPYTVLSAPVVTATPAYPYSQVEISEIDTVIGTVTITVTAEDDDYMEVYTIDFTRQLSPVTSIDAISYNYNNEANQIICTGTTMMIVLPVETEGEPIITDIMLTDNRAVFEITEQPDETNNLTGTVKVTAEDESEEIYSIIFKRTLSGSTLLTGISYYLGTTEYPLDFHPDSLTYYVILPYANSITPTVDATVAWINTEIFKSQPTTPFGQGTILVVSENGENNKTYTVVFQRKGDPHLIDMYYTLDGDDYPIPNFSPTTFTYNITLPLCTTGVPELVFLPEDNRCDITYIAQNEPNGSSSVTLVTWNEDATVTYTVNFTVLLSTEALLSDLMVNGVSMPNFNSNIFNYTVPMFPYGTELPIVSGVAKYCDAHLETTQISAFPGVASVKVTAGNPEFTKTYTVSFSIDPGNNTYLRDLLIGGLHWWEFEKNRYYYTVELQHGTQPEEYPEVEGIAEDVNSIVTYVTLEEGRIIKIYVTALNGDVAIYQITFRIKGNDNPFAKMIYVDWKPLPNFDKYVREYEVRLPEGYVGKPLVSVESEDPNASVKIEENNILPLKVFVRITAEEGEPTMTYTITFINNNTVLHYGNDVEILVYPNPSSSIIHFEINDLAQAGYLEIYSMEGKKIGNYILREGINTVNIEHLQSGFYFYKIFNDNNVLVTGKFIKQ